MSDGPGESDGAMGHHHPLPLSPIWSGRLVGHWKGVCAKIQSISVLNHSGGDAGRYPRFPDLCRIEQSAACFFLSSCTGGNGFPRFFFSEVPYFIVMALEMRNEKGEKK